MIEDCQITVLEIKRFQNIFGGKAWNGEIFRVLKIQSKDFKNIVSYLSKILNN